MTNFPCAPFFPLQKMVWGELAKAWISRNFTFYPLPPLCFLFEIFPWGCWFWRRTKEELIAKIRGERGRGQKKRGLSCFCGTDSRARCGGKWSFRWGKQRGTPTLCCGAILRDLFLSQWRHAVMELGTILCTFSLSMNSIIWS